MQLNKKLIPLVVSFGVALAAGPLKAETKLDNDDQRFSYAVGSRIGQQLLQQFTSQPGIDVEALLDGLSHSVRGEDSLLSEEEALDIINKKQQEQLATAEQEATKKAIAGLDFMEANKAKDGVVVTDSGLQYRVINAGDSSAETPNTTDTVVVHYQGTLIDGTVFDSSITRGEPATFSLQSIIPGWIEALQLMRPGDKWEVVLPPELAYGQQGAGQLIGPNEVLVFEIELLEIKKSTN